MSSAQENADLQEKLQSLINQEKIRNVIIGIVVVIIIIMCFYHFHLNEYFSPYASVLANHIFRSDPQFDQHLSKRE
jgi:hypothetical protein